MTDMLNLHGFNKSDGTDKIIANREGVFKIYNSSTGVWDNVAAPVFDPSALIDSENFLDYAFFVNGTTSNYSYDGSTWSSSTNLADSPKAKYIKEYNLQLYLGYIDLRGTTYRSRVWVSDLPKNNGVVWGLETGTDLAQTADSAVVTSAGSAFQTRNIKVGDTFTIEDGDNAGEYTVRSIDSETQITLTEELSATDDTNNFWVGGNWFDVSTGDGDYLTGFGKNSNELLIFKRNSLHRYNNLSGTLRRVKTAPGTTSGRSIVNMNEYTYYYYPKVGILRYDGVGSISISYGIEDIIDSIDTSMHENVIGWSVDSKLIKFYIGDVTTRDGETIEKCVIVFDTITQTWSSERIPYAIDQKTQWVQSSEPRAFIGTSNGKVLRDNTGYSFDNLPIALDVIDSEIFPEGDDVLVTFEKVRVFVKNGQELQLMYRLIYKPTDADNRWDIEDNWTSLKGRADGDLTEFFFDTREDRRACGIQFRFIQSSKYESPLIEKYIVYYSNPAII